MFVLNLLGFFILSSIIYSGGYGYDSWQFYLGFAAAKCIDETSKRMGGMAQAQPLGVSPR
jgi:hypothetical protein